ncbi:hypothetical protein [Phyllobacterium endophyticum]|uniref:ASCH domain-containing protein n=1 Tax=Phyllobacterium endophyticum TaxID=1149773 RepID=A0A2P7AUN6_9HYPH|nr:hypothetical protein [Phyllobacterium endophyticum]MBB3234388.1 hypothetical protein [Phyllobacterium endophyticum]PSH57911.1 hypothetical protein CU100_09480 [Phyllobacterium endophyticum]TYR44118.1 hypothetical protein FY050_02830 [Phyllobacterium endophyticum]
MTDRPILFSAPMVCALLDGRKTQTRRIMKPQPELLANGTWQISNSGGGTFGVETADLPAIAPDYVRYEIGDRLWVRETIADTGNGIGYVADGSAQYSYVWAWKRDKLPAIHMPRAVSRLTLIVTDVRVERLQDISRDDAIAEGLIRMPLAPTAAVKAGCDWGFEGDHRFGSPVSAYAALWDHINGAGAWEDNPWIVAVTFEVIKQNIDGVA